MIDIETEIFNSISVKVREKYSQIFLTGEYVKSPPSFPCASIVEVDNQIYRNTRTTECMYIGDYWTIGGVNYGGLAICLRWHISFQRLPQRPPQAQASTMPKRKSKTV